VLIPPRSTLFPYTTLFRSFDVPGSSMKTSQAVLLLSSALALLSFPAACSNDGGPVEDGDGDADVGSGGTSTGDGDGDGDIGDGRSEEHTSELQSRENLVCR